MKYLSILLLLCFGPFWAYCQIETNIDTVSFQVKHGKRLLKRNWKYEKTTLEIVKNDTIIKTTAFWYAYKYVSPNTLQIWKTKISKVVGNQVIYKRKRKASFLLFRGEETLYDKIWKLNKEGKFLRINN